MGKDRYSRKRGCKRPRSPKKSGMSRLARKDQRTKVEIDSRSAYKASKYSSEDESAIDSEEEAEEGNMVHKDSEEEAEEGNMVHKEPTDFDNLLKTLAYGRRQREEEGKCDIEEKLESGLESSSASEEEDDGTDTDSPRRLCLRYNTQDSGVVHGTDDDEASKTDEESVLTVNGQSALEASVGMSAFSDHLDYKLSKGEIDNLLKRNWKYKWEVPAFDMSNCKWLGTGECFIKDVDLSASCGLKLRLYKHWLDIYKASGGTDFHLSKQRYFFSLCNSYRDILHHNKKPFYLKGVEEDSSIMDAYLMHSLNHIFKTRDLLTKNDAKVAKHQEGAMAEVLNEEAFLDHGFTRPKVVILLPLASTAFRVVKRLIQLTPSSHKVNVEHLDRFSNEFATGVGDINEDNEGSDAENLKSQKAMKPSDFQALFGGNNNDHFMIGIKYTRRSIKLYSDFYSSDMIVASPLGLITKIGEAEVEKEKDVDYLSSIEVLIIDQADIITMQNWSHVNTVVEQLNHIPSKQHGTDIMRIRQWYLDGHAQFYRQTIILGSYSNPEINALFNRHCVNYKGKVKLVCNHKGVLSRVLLQVRQIYERFVAESIVDVDDARLEYFAKKVFPKLKDSIQGGIMLFISSYFEFVRVRNFLKSQDASFCLLGEYTKQSDISRARVWFFQGRRKIILYTERAHFYHRYKIRGIQNIIIYSLPERKEFYHEIVNMIEGAHSMTCTVLFSRFDHLRLERIVGTPSAKRMLTSEKSTFVFC